MKAQNTNNLPLRILHLEDSSFDIELLTMHLRSLKRPFSIKHVSTEEEFRKCLERSFIDIVISDSNLPGFDTSQALSFVRNYHSSTPFIFFSGHLSPEIQKEAIFHGASAFIEKNDPGRLVSTIERLCSAKNLPPPGHSVIVQCKGYRCLACLTQDGKWVDVLHRNELSEVISWQDA